jgi:5,10-methylenetetrahydrofolate reductase
VQSGDHPEAKPVFDLDSTSLLATIKKMRDDRTFLSGRKITDPPRLFLGAAENPFAPPYDWRALRLAKKVAAGAQYFQTQYCYDIPMLKSFMQKVRDMGTHEKCFILVGVGPLPSAKTARWMRSNVAGVHIPDDVIARLDGAENQKAEGIKLCIELIQQIREVEGVAGVHIMAYRQEESVGHIVQESGVLAGRQPFRRAFATAADSEMPPSSVATRQMV